MPVPTTINNIREENYRYLQRQVYSATGIVLERNKHYLFESRLLPIVYKLGLETINDLCTLLQGSHHNDLDRQVVEAMTINETYFFRDPSQYHAISRILLPRLTKERAESRRMRFWSAAASTGQEAYSLAMLLIDAGLAAWDIHILGTDISSQAIARARSARYLQVEMNRGLPRPLLERHFCPHNSEWQLSHAARKMVCFETADLRETGRVREPFDLVFCRNVMIYFDAGTKKSVLQNLHGALNPGGWLFLGAAEAALGYEKWFDRKLIESATVFIARGL